MRGPLQRPPLYAKRPEKKRARVDQDIPGSEVQGTKGKAGPVYQVFRL